MHALSLLALAAALALCYRQLAAHPHERARKLVRGTLAILALAMIVGAGQVLPGDIRRVIDSGPTAAEREADRAFLMIHALGSPEAFIDYLRATQATKE